MTHKHTRMLIPQLRKGEFEWKREHLQIITYFTIYQSIEHWMIMAIHEYHNKYSHRNRLAKQFTLIRLEYAIHFANFVLLNAERI